MGYPPFQFIVEGPFYYFFSSFLNTFLALRLNFVCIELLTFALLLKVLDLVGLDEKLKNVIKWIFILSPHQFFVTTVFLQEEVISEFFLLLAYYFALQKRRDATLWTLISGVIFAKIFFIIPYFYYLVFHGFKKKDLLTFTPLVLVNILHVVVAKISGGLMPFAGFSPGGTFGSHYWVLIINYFKLLGHESKRISVLISAFMQLALVIPVFFKKYKEGKHPSIELTFVFPVAVFYFTFFQHNPEYMILFAPILLMHSNSVKEILLKTLFLILPWLPNIFYGLYIVKKHNIPSPSKQMLLRHFERFVPIDLHILHYGSIILYSICFTVILYVLFGRLRNSNIPLAKPLVE